MNLSTEFLVDVKADIKKDKVFMTVVQKLKDQQQAAVRTEEQLDN